MNTALLRPIDKLAGWWLTMRTRQEAAKDTACISVDIQEDRTVATYMSQSIAALADEAAEMLRDAQAENYIQFDMLPRIDRRLPQVRVTVAWANGEMPAQKAARLVEERSALLLSFWDILDQVMQQSGETPWAGDVTAHEALTRLADQVDPAIGKMFQARMEA